MEEERVTYSELRVQSPLQQHRSPAASRAKGTACFEHRVWKCQPCGDGWQQHGKHCYSFSREQIPWSSCELHCSPLRSSFLKISTEGEMEFVKRMSKKQCFLYEDKFGFSLYYNSSQMKWVWLDGSAFILDKLQLKRPNTPNNQCKYIKNGQVIDGSCQENSHCICKKTAYGD
nr:C-type lectin domain family 1 member A-like [Oryctolagus cuniculus]